MALAEVPRSQWARFCARFGAQHRDWLVSLHIFEGIHCGRTLVREMPLGALTAELGHGRYDSITIEFDERVPQGVGPGGLVAVVKRLQHTVPEPRRLFFGVRADGAHEGLWIEAAGGVTVRLEFHVPAIPEEVDGLVP